MDEISLIERLKQGDSSAFDEIVNRFRKQVFTTCIGFVHNAEDAEDLAQDVFIEVFRSIRNFRSDSKLSTWLYRIAVNKSLNLLRKHKKNTMLVFFENMFGAENGNEQEKIYASESTEADKNFELKELKKVLEKAIDSLPKNQKTAFVLAKYDEMSYSEISEIMGLSLSSVESLIHRAKTGLQKKLTNYKNNSL
jgi:RNA polymerase sigma-70 factor, ECF subfamily